MPGRSGRREARAHARTGPVAVWPRRRKLRTRLSRRLLSRTRLRRRPHSLASWLTRRRICLRASSRRPGCAMPSIQTRRPRAPLATEARAKLAEGRRLLDAGHVTEAVSLFDAGHPGAARAVALGSAEPHWDEEDAAAAFETRRRETASLVSAIEAGVLSSESQDRIAALQRRLAATDAEFARARWSTRDPRWRRSISDLIKFIGEIRRGETLFVSRTFETAEEEYEYERQRNEAYALLVKIAVAERQDGDGGWPPSPRGWPARAKSCAPRRKPKRARANIPKPSRPSRGDTAPSGRLAWRRPDLDGVAVGRGIVSRHPTFRTGACADGWGLRSDFWPCFRSRPARRSMWAARRRSPSRPATPSGRDGRTGALFAGRNPDRGDRFHRSRTARALVGGEGAGWVAGLVIGERQYKELMRPVAGMARPDGTVLVVDAGRKAVAVFDLVGRQFLIWDEARPGIGLKARSPSPTTARADIW